jgi:hypothetical protein
MPPKKATTEEEAINFCGKLETNPTKSLPMMSKNVHDEEKITEAVKTLANQLGGNEADERNETPEAKAATNERNEPIAKVGLLF